MRHRAGSVVVLVITLVALGWFWGRNRDETSPAANAGVPLQMTVGKVVRGTAETGLAREALRARTKGSYGFDVWRETSCDGVAVFYMPDAEDEDVAWYSFDLQTEQLVEQATLGEVEQALDSQLEGFEPDTPRCIIGQLKTPKGRPLYSIGTEKLGGTVQVGFSPNRCSAVPDVAQVMYGKGPSPVNIDLPAAIEQIRQRKGNEADW